MPIDVTINLVNLQTTSQGIDGVLLTWTNDTDGCLTYVGQSVAQIWRATVNDRTQAIKLAEVEGNSYIDTGFDARRTFYYWVRAKNTSGELGPWEPSDVNNGVTGIPTSSNSELYTQTPGNPASLTAKGGVGFITLSWENPSDPVRNVEVFWAQSGNSRPFFPQRVIGSGSATEIGGLTPGQDFDFWIRATNNSFLRSGIIGPETASNAAGELAELNNSEIVFFQDIAPSHKDGRLWVETDTGDVFRSDGTNWIFIASQNALNLSNAPNEAGADNTLDHANDIVVFSTNAPPHKDGRLWFDSNASVEKLKRSNGFSWSVVGDETFLHTAADIINQGALATQDAASFNTDILDIPNRITNNATAGLNVTDTHLGYYDGSNWQVFIRSNGNFQFNGDSGNFIIWDGTSMDIRGELNADDINAGTINTERLDVTEIFAQTVTVSGDLTLDGNILLNNGKLDATTADGSVVIDSTGITGKGDIANNGSLVQTFRLPTDGSAPEFSAGVIKETEFKLQTSSIIRTSEGALDGTSDSAGVVIDENGVFAGANGQDTNNANVQIRSDGTGSIKAGAIDVTDINADNITAGTITGRTLQTANSGERFVVDAANAKASWFDSGGNEVFRSSSIDDAALGIPAVLRVDTASSSITSDTGNATATGLYISGKGNAPAIIAGASQLPESFIRINNSAGSIQGISENGDIGGIFYGRTGDGTALHIVKGTNHTGDLLKIDDVRINTVDLGTANHGDVLVRNTGTTGEWKILDEGQTGGSFDGNAILHEGQTGGSFDGNTILHEGLSSASLGGSDILLDSDRSANGGSIAEVPASSTAESTTFDNWVTNNTNSLLWVAINANAITDGTTKGSVSVLIDESGGTSPDFGFDIARADSALGNGGLDSGSLSFPVTPGASYQVKNGSDPTGTNAFNVARSWSL